MIVTRLELHKASTERGGYTRKQVDIARKLTGSHENCISKLVGLTIPDDQWKSFCDLAQNTAKKTKKHSIKEWKKKKSVAQSDRSKKKNELKKAENLTFFSSSDWLRLRVNVLEKYGSSCMMCGRNYREDKVKIHVDHIKPRSKYPELALAMDNLQVLCHECNVGKGNRYETDYRP